jgi:hypothetical protein
VNRGMLSAKFLLDDLARVFASTMPRRKMLKIALGSLVGACFAGMGVKSARAQSSANGCGSFGLEGIIPQRFGTANFQGCCGFPGFPCGSPGSGGGHDCCYATCGSDKNQCDEQLLECMVNVCNTAYPCTSMPPLSEVGDQNCLDSTNCWILAWTYYAAVRTQKGQDAYNQAQQDSHCCPPGQAYCSGGCVDITTDPNNCGGCGVAGDTCPTEGCELDYCCPKGYTCCCGWCNSCAGCGDCQGG